MPSCAARRSSAVACQQQDSSQQSTLLKRNVTADYDIFMGKPLRVIPQRAGPDARKRSDLKSR